MMDTIESGLFKGLPRTWRRGWLEGYLKGILEGLLFQLETKFGSLPPEIVERVRDLRHDQWPGRRGY